jgi:pimeloyl-ACP methyl ester carboxylesterase
LPFLTVHDIRLFYRLEGKAGAPVIVLSHSIGADHGMWAQQAADLLPYFQVLRCDIPSNFWGAMFSLSPWPWPSQSLRSAGCRWAEP